MISSYSRGHEIIFLDNKWVYRDNYDSMEKERPCKRCGMVPTKEGYDFCIGHIEEVVSTCCGHGVTNKIMISKEPKC
jgi:hypothetical protein